MKHAMIKLPILFEKEDGLDLKELGIDSQEEKEANYAVFNMYSIDIFNPSTDRVKTDVTLKSGVAFIVDMPINKFEELYCKMCGKKIETII